jgi:RsiW-degrading membrane proteinase PrsW (M82 family)
MPSIESNETTILLHRPGLKERLFFLFSGIVVSIPIAFFFEPTAGFLKTFFDLSSQEVATLAIVIFAPFIEEFAKAYPLFFRHGESQRSIMMLGILVGFGFGITEFLEYVLILGASPLIRLPGIFFHAASNAAIAYGIATKKSPVFYFVAVLLHFSINLMAISHLDLSNLAYGLLLTITYLLAIMLYNRASEKMIPY